MGKRIQVYDGDRLVSEYELGTEPFTIGRAPENFICLNHSSISGKHARIMPTMLDPVIEDLGSTNGTYVNGHKLAGPYVLRNGDTVKLPKFSIKYLRDDKRALNQSTEASGGSTPSAGEPATKSDFAAWWEQRKRGRGQEQK